VGELVVFAPHVCASYYQNPEAVAENKIRDGTGAVWHRMGDTGYFDGQGRFWLVGRVHSTVFRQGVAVHPQLVEQVCLTAENHLQQVAALGLPDSALGERLVIVAVPRPGASRDGLVTQVRQKLRSAAIPCDDMILRSSPLPVDPRHNSKIDYGALRAELMKRQ
jgi:acyl-CoA synthetase (AMP-forming)/AMP-acid ligase II